MKTVLCVAGVLVGASMSILAYGAYVDPRRPTPIAPYIPLVGGPFIAAVSIAAFFLS